MINLEVQKKAYRDEEEPDHIVKGIHIIADSEFKNYKLPWSSDIRKYDHNPRSVAEVAMMLFQLGKLMKDQGLPDYAIELLSKEILNALLPHLNELAINTEYFTRSRVNG